MYAFKVLMVRSLRSLAPPIIAPINKVFTSIEDAKGYYNNPRTIKGDAQYLIVEFSSEDEDDKGWAIDFYPKNK